MGNRAVVEFKDGTGIYLHWNGGPESVLAFLDTAKHFKVRTNEDYGVARLVQIIGNFFGGTLSLGVGRAEGMDKDNWDNGTYYVDENFDIDRRGGSGSTPVTKVEQLSADELTRYERIKSDCITINQPFFAKE